MVEVIASIPDSPDNSTYSINVTCTVHPDSNAEQCVVIATRGITTRRGNKKFLCNMIRTYVYLVCIKGKRCMQNFI